MDYWLSSFLSCGWSASFSLPFFVWNCRFSVIISLHEFLISHLSQTFFLWLLLNYDFLPPHSETVNFCKVYQSCSFVTFFPLLSNVESFCTQEFCFFCFLWGSRAFRANRLRLRGHSAFLNSDRLSNAMGPQFPHLKTRDKNTYVVLLDGLKSVYHMLSTVFGKSRWRKCRFFCFAVTVLPEHFNLSGINGWCKTKIYRYCSQVTIFLETSHWMAYPSLFAASLTVC